MPMPAVLTGGNFFIFRDASSTYRTIENTLICLIQLACTTPTVPMKFDCTSSRRCFAVTHSGVQSLTLKFSVGSCCRPGMSTWGSAGGQSVRRMRIQAKIHHAGHSRGHRQPFGE
eukprot:1154903-Pelagomonas_calceolata.AAC.7